MLHIISCNAGTWLFVDETLVRSKNKASSKDNDSSDPPDETNSSDNSSDPPYSNDSGIELLQSNTADKSSVLPEDTEKEEDNVYLFEIDDSGSATDSDYDARSDTELLITRRTNKDIRYYCENYKRKCLQTFSILKLARKVMQRTTDCIGGFVACAACLWTYDYTKCKTDNLKKKTAGCGQALCLGIWRMFKLMLDRRVFLSVSLYGIIAFLAIISNEVGNSSMQ